MKKIVYFCLALLAFSACAPSTPKTPEARYEYKTFSDSVDLMNAELLNALSKDYVTFGRTFDWSSLGFTPTDSMFTSDSLRYADAVKTFYNSGPEMVDWLMSFHADSTQNGLWSMTPHPLSSYISECNLFPTNDKSGIILLENFLGKERASLRCLECSTCEDCAKGDSCVASRYRRMELFLSTHHGVSVDELRKAWAERKTI
jgi:hypothetical protein